MLKKTEKQQVKAINSLLKNFAKDVSQLVEDNGSEVGVTLGIALAAYGVELTFGCGSALADEFVETISDEKARLDKFHSVMVGFESELLTALTQAGQSVFQGMKFTIDLGNCEKGDCQECDSIVIPEGTVVQ